MLWPELSCSHRCLRLVFKSFLCGATWVRQPGQRVMAAGHRLGGAVGQGKRRCKRGLLLPCPLMSRLPVMCHSFLDGSPGWELWQSGRAGPLSFLSPPAAQGRAWLSCWVGLGAQSWGGVRDLTSSTFFFTQPNGVRQHLSFFSGQRCVF